jgi:hypothetical protein
MANPIGTVRVLVAHVTVKEASGEVVGYCLNLGGGSPVMIATLNVDAAAAQALQSQWLPTRGSFFADFDPSSVVRLQELEASTGAYLSVKKSLEDDVAAFEAAQAL